MNAVMRCLTLVLFLSLVVGCSGGKIPVRGKVTYQDGTPVPGGTIIGEAKIDGKTVSIQGNIESNGSFSMGTATPGDGALPGSYRFLIMPVALGDSELAAGMTPAVGGKYSKFESSGITFEVTDGSKELNITVEKPKGKN